MVIPQLISRKNQLCPSAIGFSDLSDTNVWQVQAVELLLLLGQIHQAAGVPLTALPYILSCLLHSTDLHMDLLVSHHLSQNFPHLYVTPCTPCYILYCMLHPVLHVTPCTPHVTPCTACYTLYCMFRPVLHVTPCTACYTLYCMLHPVLHVTPCTEPLTRCSIKCEEASVSWVVWVASK